MSVFKLRKVMLQQKGGKTNVLDNYSLAQSAIM